MKEIINSMKNLSMKVMYVCGKAVSEKAHVDQLLKERLDAGIARKSASDTLEIVLPAEFDRIGNCIFPIPETPSLSSTLAIFAL